MFLPFSAPTGFLFDNKPNTYFNDEEWLIFSNNKLLVDISKKTIPKYRPISPHFKTYLGHHKNKNIFAACIEVIENMGENWIFDSLRNLHGVISDDYLSLAGRAL